MGSRLGWFGGDGEERKIVETKENYAQGSGSGFVRFVRQRTIIWTFIVVLGMTQIYSSICLKFPAPDKHEVASIASSILSFRSLRFHIERERLILFGNMQMGGKFGKKFNKCFLVGLACVGFGRAGLSTSSSIWDWNPRSKSGARASTSCLSGKLSCIKELLPSQLKVSFVPLTLMIGKILANLTRRGCRKLCYFIFLDRYIFGW